MLSVLTKIKSSLGQVPPLLQAKLLDGFSQAQDVELATVEKNCLQMFASKLDSCQASGNLLFTDIRLDLSSQEKGLCWWDEWFVI